MSEIFDIRERVAQALHAADTVHGSSHTAVHYLPMADAAIGQLTKWQPIDTAPKNGDEVLLFREDAGVILARWTCPIEFMSERELEASSLSEDEANEADWFYADFICGGRLDEPATHWMPLPPGPSDKP